jgi:hypothetical protein
MPFKQPLGALLATALFGLALITCAGRAYAGSEECIVKGQKLTAIKSVKSNGDGTVTIFHSVGVGRFALSDLDAEFLKSWGLSKQSVANREGPAPSETAQLVQRRIKLERGVWGGYKAEYEFVLLRNLFNTGISRWDAGGSVEIFVAGADTIGLFFWNRHSPENRDKSYKGQFPGQGLLEISENDVATLASYLNKFLKWEALADKEGLKGVDKDIGVLGEYQFSYHRSELSQGWCTVIRKLEDIKDFKKVLESNITIFPPAAVATLQLLELRGKLREEKRARESAEQQMKEKADSLLK